MTVERRVAHASFTLVRDYPAGQRAAFEALMTALNEGDALSATMTSMASLRSRTRRGATRRPGRPTRFVQVSHGEFRKLERARTTYHPRCRRVVCMKP